MPVGRITNSAVPCGDARRPRWPVPTTAATPVAETRTSFARRDAGGGGRRELLEAERARAASGRRALRSSVASTTTERGGDAERLGGAGVDRDLDGRRAER